MRRALIGLASVLAVATMTGPGAKTASAADMFEEADCRKSVQGKFYAQANRAILFAETDGTGVDDNGNPTDGSEVFLVDNDNSSSRFGFKGVGFIDCFWSAGMHIELEVESNPSNGVEFNNDANNDNPDQRFELKERIIDTWIAHKGLGKITIGQGKTASDGAMEVNLSKTGVITSVDLPDYMGDIAYGIGSGAIVEVDINDLYRVLDGMARQDRIRYDSPTFAGFMLSTSYTEDDDWDLALRYANEFGRTRFAAAAYYADSQFDAGIAHSGRAFHDSYGGSASILFPIGFNITAAYAVRDWADPANAQRDGKEGETYYVKLGWIFDWFNIGYTAFAIDYGHGEDHHAIADDAACAGDGDCAGEGYGAYVVQKLLDGVEAYGGIRVHTADYPGLDLEDVYGVMTGLRVKM